jgi:hypothetical protein
MGSGIPIKSAVGADFSEMRNALYTGGTCSKKVSPSQEKNMVSISPLYLPKSLAYKENVGRLFCKIKSLFCTSFTLKSNRKGSV